MPDEDRLSITRQQLEATLVKAYGGRVAEEVIFGRDKVTTGAASDIQQATKLARRFVMQWGFSDAIGPVLVGDNEQEMFLGRELTSRREISERTAQLVDTEVGRVIQESYQRARQVLTENNELLHTIASALLERETLNREDIDTLARGEKLPARNIPSAPAAPLVPRITPVSVPRQTGKPLLEGGPEPSPA
jgi:cell division protease FtsH